MCVHAGNLAPVDVVLNTINRQGNHFNASLLELSAVLGGAAQLGSADRCEVPRVGEQDAPSDEGDKTVWVHKLYDWLNCWGLWSGLVTQWKAKDQPQCNIAQNLHRVRTTDVMSCSKEEEVAATFCFGKGLETTAATFGSKCLGIRNIYEFSRLSFKQTSFKHFSVILLHMTDWCPLSTVRKGRTKLLAKEQCDHVVIKWPGPCSKTNTPITQLHATYESPLTLNPSYTLSNQYTCVVLHRPVQDSEIGLMIKEARHQQP